MSVIKTCTKHLTSFLHLCSPSCPLGGLSSSSDSRPAVVRYRKDQRPTTLPIQPFTFHHQFATKPPQPKPLLPLLTGYVSAMQAGSGSGSDSGGPVGEDGEDAAESAHRHQGALVTAAPPPASVRPSPLGSYSPVRLQGGPGSSTCSTCSPSPQPPHSLSCTLSAGLGQLHTPPAGKQGRGSAQLPSTPPPPSLGVKRGVVPPMLPAVHGHCLHRGGLASLHGDTLSPLGCLDSGNHVEGNIGPGVRAHNGRFQRSWCSWCPSNKFCRLSCEFPVVGKKKTSQFSC